MNEILKISMESARIYMKFVCEGLGAQIFRKSDLVKGLVSFDFSVFFLQPKEQTALCYGCLFSSFGARV